MLTKNVYDIPYPETTPVDMDGIKDFFDDTLVPFFAEKMGLVVRTDLAVMGPEYAANSYVCFLAPSASADPYLSIYNSNSANDYRFTVYCIAPVIKNENVFRPINVVGASGAASSFMHPNILGGSITLQSSNFGTYKSTLAMIDLNDGRKVAAFRCITISSGDFYAKISASSIYFGKIKMQGDLIDTCVVFAQGVNSSWIDEYEQCASSQYLTGRPGINLNSNYINNVGFLFANNLGKEALISFDFCIGEDAYIPNTFWYSDVRTASNINAGSIIMLDNKKYVCLGYPISALGQCKLLIPEEVN